MRSKVKQCRNPYLDGVFQFAQVVHGLLIGWVFIGFLLVCLSLFIVDASFGYLLGVILVSSE